MNLITFDNIRNFAYVNDDLIKDDIKGIIIDFFGLGGQNMYNSPLQESVVFAKLGYLHIIPYYNPWSWMNDAAVDYCERLLDILTVKYSLEDVPLVTCGASMGGLAALVFCYRSKKQPIACITNCPVCDLLYHYTEHNDMPRTIYSAFYKPNTDFFEQIKRCSPLHHIDDLPDIKYVLFQCMEDDDVHPYAHSEKMVKALRDANKSIEYIKVPDSGHCQLNQQYLDMYFKRVAEGFCK